MAEVRAEDIKELREETGVSVMDIKKALSEAKGDKAKARELLKERGAVVARKKSDREPKAGAIESYVHGDGSAGAMVKLVCETDFVARSSEFKSLAHDIAMQIVAMNPSDVSGLMEQQFIKDPSLTIKERIEEAVGKLGENIAISSFTRLEL